MRSIRQGYGAALPAVLLVLAVYVWLITAGTWTTWHSPTRNYANLARGILRGQLSVPGRPDPGLQQIENPYDPKARSAADVDVAIDLSYYRGQYYLYWGPVPAILLAGLAPFVRGRVGDLVVTFFFVVGLLLVQASLLTYLRARYFRIIPAWLLGTSIAALGLAGPTSYLLNNTNAARIYEAAITGGQFFLLGGLAVLTGALGRRSSPVLPLVAAGGLWALAVGTRLLLAVPIGVLALMTAIWFGRNQGWVSAVARRVLPLAMPLMLAAGALGWYNWARFGSVFETGLRYAFAGENIHENYNHLFDPSYVRLNAYNYILQPFRLSARPPFVYAGHGSDETVLCPATCPTFFHASPVIGVLAGTPCVVFALVPFLRRLRRRRDAAPEAGPDGEPAAELVPWLETSLALAALSALLVLLNYWVASLRFMHDFMPALLTLSTLGVWHGYAATRTSARWRALYVPAALLLLAVTIALGVLPAASTYADWYAGVQ